MSSLVHGYLQAVKIDHFIAVVRLVLERHVVRKPEHPPPTTATRNAVGTGFCIPIDFPDFWCLLSG